MIKKISLLRASVLYGLFSPAALVMAQADSLELNEMVVVAATRSTIAVEDSPRTITVIGPERIAEYANAGGIQRLLSEIPGIEYARTGGLGGQLVIRGQNTNSGRAILAIDGDRYRGRSTLEYNLIDPNSIERIEIIRGPASALYGSDAMNGVINIVTRRARVEETGEFRLAPKLRAAEWSSDSNMYAVRGELVGGGKGFDVLIGVNKRTANDYDTPAGRARNSDYDMKGIDFNIGYRPNSESRWELSGRYQNVTTGRAGGLGAAPGALVMEVRESPIVERYVRLGYQGWNFGSWADSLDTSFYVRDLETDIHQVNRKNPNFDVHAHIKVYTPTVYGGHLTASKQLGDHNLSYGGDWFHERFDGRKNNIRRYTKTGSFLADSGWNKMERDTKQSNFGLFINDDWFVDDRWSLTAALRGDLVKVEVGSALLSESPAVSTAFNGNTNNLNKAVTGSIGTVYRVTPEWHLIANLSRGFRAPSGNELAVTSIAGTITTIPSPDLDPETNITAEAGVRWYGKNSELNITAYQSKYDDLIATVAVSADVMQRRNISKAKISGVELAGETVLGGPWTLRYSATATRGKDEASGQPLSGISPLSGQMNLRYQATGWHVESAIRGYQGRTRIDKTLERKTSSYSIVDLYAGLNLGQVFGADWKDWSVQTGVENIFDRLGRNPSVSEDLSYANELVGNPLAEPGRTAMIKLRVDY